MKKRVHKTGSGEFPKPQIPSPEDYPKTVKPVERLISDKGQIVVHAEVFFSKNARCQISADTYLFNPAHRVEAKLLFAYNIEIADLDEVELGAPERLHKFTLVFEGLPEWCEVFHLHERPLNGSEELFYPNIRRNKIDVYYLSEDEGEELPARFDKPLWTQKYLQDSKYRNIRLKCCGGSYPTHIMDNDIMDIVDEETFFKVEEQRIPLFIGSQYGINPLLSKMPEFFNGRKEIAVLSMSRLSGMVGGLSIYQLQVDDTKFEGEQDWKIASFLNRG